MVDRANTIIRCSGVSNLSDGEEIISVPPTKAEKRLATLKSLAKGVFYWENYGILTNDMIRTVKSIKK